MKEKNETLESVKKDIMGLGFFTVYLFLLVALFTFSPDDIAACKYPPAGALANKCGIVGAHVAYFLFRWFGLSIAVTLAVCGMWIVKFLLSKEIKHFYLKTLSLVILTAATAVALEIQPLFDAGTAGLASVTPSAGGIVGAGVYAQLTAIIGKFGAAAAVFFVWLLSSFLATDWATMHALAWAMSKIRKQKKREIPTNLDEEENAPPVEDDVGPTVEQEPSCETEEVEEKPITTKAKSETSIQKPAKISDTNIQETIRQLTNGVPEHKPIPYKLPPLDVFENEVERVHEVTKEDIQKKATLIESALLEYGVRAKVVRVEHGPTISMYEIELAPGTKLTKVGALSDELAMKLMVPSIRIVAPLPGKGTVGVEVPNPFPDTVRLREFYEKGRDELRKIPLPVVLGKSNSGEAIIRNLTDMPHLLIGGQTGSGKSVCLKSIIASLIATKSPEEMKMLLIDPKMVELSVFEDIPHLWAPVITDSKKAASVLDWLTKEMDDRYQLFNKVRVMKIDTYNQLGKEEIEKRLANAGIPKEQMAQVPERLPYIVVVVDELADLMIVAGREVEMSIMRLTQKARAVGIHIVAATQRPSADIVTGLIKANMTARVAFKVTSNIESKIILESKGAERLLGKGDMLISLPGMHQPVRAQCTFVSEEEISKLAAFLKSLGDPQYHNEIIEIESEGSYEGTPDDELFDEAVRIVLDSRRGSISLLQRELKIGYQRAARLIETMEKFGVVGPYNGANPRAVLLSFDQWDQLKQKIKEQGVEAVTTQTTSVPPQEPQA